MPTVRRIVNGDSVFMDGHLVNGTSWRSGSSTTSCFHIMSAGWYRFPACMTSIKPMVPSRHLKISSRVSCRADCKSSVLISILFSCRRLSAPVRSDKRSLIAPRTPCFPPANHWIRHCWRWVEDREAHTQKIPVSPTVGCQRVPAVFLLVNSQVYMTTN